MILGRFVSFKQMRRYNSDLGCMRLRGPDDAMALYEDMERMRPRPSLFYFKRLLIAVVKMKQYSVALHLFDKMLQRDALVDHYTLNMAIDCHCKLKRPELGFAILGVYFKRGYEPSVVTFNTLINGLVLVGRIDDASKLLKKMRDGQHYCKPKPNKFAYTSVIGGLLNTRRFSEAEHLLKEMVAHKVYPDVITCNVFISAFCKEAWLEAAEELVDVMKKQIGLEPGIDTYNTLINGYCVQGKMDEAVNIIHRAVNSGLKPDITTYNTLMNGYLKIGHLTQVSRVFAIIRAQGLEQDVVSYSTMLQALFSEGRVEDSLNLFKENMESFSDIRAYNILFDRLCRAHRIGEAKDLFDKLPSRGLQPTVVTYKILIGALCRQGQIDEAKDLLLQMVNNGCLPNGVTYNVFVQRLLKRNKIEDQTMHLHLLVNDHAN